MSDGELIGRVRNSMRRQCQERDHAAPVDTLRLRRSPRRLCLLESTNRYFSECTFDAKYVVTAS